MVLTRSSLTGLVAAALCLLLSLTAWWFGGTEPAARRAPAGDEAASATTVVRVWDAARSRAWAAGDTAALRALYTRGSPVGRQDVAMLEEYVARGLVVEGLTTQLLEVAEVRRDEDVWVLEVTDRVHAGTVVGQGVRRALPRDGTSTRRVTLRRGAGGWRVARVVARSSVAQAG